MITLVTLITERLGVPDFYGVYIAPSNDESFILYNQDEYRIDQLIRKLRKEWPFMRDDSTDAIKEYIREEFSSAFDFDEFIDESDMYDDDFNGSNYKLGNKQIWVKKSFT